MDDQIRQPLTTSYQAQEVVPRSPKKLPRHFFEKLVNLHDKQPWLQTRQEELFELFDLCESDDEQQFISDLLYRFFYLEETKFTRQVDALRDHIVDVWNLPPENTRIVSIRRSDYSDSSDFILYLLKSSFARLPASRTSPHQWETINFVSGIGAGIKKLSDNSNIVLVDEFVGSGTTMASQLGWMSTKIAETGVRANFFIASVAAMRAAEGKLHSLGAKVFVANWLARGISDHFTGADLERAVEMMQRLESELCSESANKSLKKYYFGFKRTEALYYRSNGNTPNNVFPIFWWKYLKLRRPRQPLLTRI